MDRKRPTRPTPVHRETSVSPSETLDLSGTEALINANVFNGLDGLLSIVIQGGKHRLGPIKGFASLIQDDTNDDTNARRWADKIMRNVRQIEDHYDSLNMFCINDAIGVGESSWHRLISELMDHFAAVNVRGVPIEVTNDARGSFLQHGELLRRVLIHLVVNAYESIAKTGKLTLTVCERSPHDGGRRRFGVRIADSGSGIDARNANLVWKPFFTTKHDHLGLGLPYVAAAGTILGMKTEFVSAVAKGTVVDLDLSEQGG